MGDTNVEHLCGTRAFPFERIIHTQLRVLILIMLQGIDVNSGLSSICSTVPWQLVKIIF